MACTWLCDSSVGPVMTRAYLRPWLGSCRGTSRECPRLHVTEASPWGSSVAAGPALPLPPFSWSTRTTASLLCGAGSLRVWGGGQPWASCRSSRSLMWVMGRELQEGSVGETQGGKAPSPPLGAPCMHWSEPGDLLLSSVVELGWGSSTLHDRCCSAA